METRWPLKSVAAVAAASLVLILAAALFRVRWLFAIAALLFGAAAIIAAYKFNRPMWARTPTPGEPAATPASALYRTSIYSAIVYAWGAAAMILSYPIARLPWQHGWQYGLAMAAVAASMAYYLKRLDQGHPELTSEKAVQCAVHLAKFQGIAMLSGLAALAVSGKLTAPVVDWKAEWAANIVFATGGLSLALLSAFIAKTHTALTRRSK